MAQTTLVPVTEARFAWLIRGYPPVEDGLALPPGGVDDAQTLEHVRRIMRRLGGEGRATGWMMVADGEVVGLCGFKTNPSPAGEIEIGYGVAASRRERGHATHAVAAVLDVARDDPRVRVVVAETVVSNSASQRVLIANGFERAGSRIDSTDGELLRWEKRVRAV